jgi:hypothetical protein
MDRVEKDFHHSGKPFHVADPSRSMFYIVSLQDFDKMSDQEVQALHAHSHILVTGHPQESFGFDAKGLATLAAPTRVFTIQGEFSYLRKNPHLFSLRRLLHCGFYKSKREVGTWYNSTSFEKLQFTHRKNTERLGFSKKSWRQPTKVPGFGFGFFSGYGMPGRGGGVSSIRYALGACCYARGIFLLPCRQRRTGHIYLLHK